MASTAVSHAVYRAAVNVLSERFGARLPSPGLSSMIKIVEGRRSPVFIAWKVNHGPQVLREEVEFLRAYGKRFYGRRLPIIYVLDYVGPVLQEVLENEIKVHWLDLSENGNIRLPDFRYYQTGNPNKYMTNRSRDNPATIYGARVLRALLTDTEGAKVVGISEKTGVDKALVSRMFKNFSEKGWMTVTHGKGIYVHDAGAILDYWRVKHKIVVPKRKTDILMGRVSSPSVSRISDTLRIENYNYAWTMMPACAAYVDFGTYKHLAVYLDKDPELELADYLDMDIHSEAPNMWIIVHSREDTFENVIEINGINYVDPFRTFVDLRHCPDTNEPTATNYLREYILRTIIHR